MIKVKNLFLTISLVLLSNPSFAAPENDSLNICFDRIQASNAIIQTLEQENDALKSEVSTLHTTISELSAEIDSLESVISETNNGIAALADSLNINISSTKEQIQTHSESLNQTIAEKSQTGLWIFIIFAVIIAAISFIFGKLIAKRRDEVSSLSAKADRLNEEIVSRLTSEMSDMQSLSKQIGTIASTPVANLDAEQKLIITLADRITFMEVTLYKMDSSVRGHKQLSRSIKQMKDNLLANGYEIVDMLGKDYHDGMRVIANFIEDENLPQSKQIITGIIKPQINYHGKMIQSAQITVSQNL